MSEDSEGATSKHLRLPGDPDQSSGGKGVPNQAETLPTIMDLNNESMVQAGRRITPDLLKTARRYEVRGEVGRGGMGVIQQIWDNALLRTSARKVIRPGRTSQRAALGALVREAQVTGQLDHPNIVPVYDFGIDDRGGAYFTMKLVKGRTLAHIVRTLPPVLSQAQLFDLLEIVVKVCDALSFAHSKGVIHLDIKPANIMVGDFGQVYLMDWGLASLSKEAGSAQKRKPASGLASPEPDSTIEFADQRTAHVTGTPCFMAPEQARGTDYLDKRTDVFGIGALLYTVISRRPPYSATTPTKIMKLAATGKFLPLSRATPGGNVPRQLEQIVAKAMARTPEERFPSVEELRRELVSLMRGEGDFERRDYAEGELILREGEIGEEAYIILTGECEIYRIIDGERRTLRIVRDGDIFGEAGILTSAARTANVVATETTTVFVVTKEQLEDQLGLMRPWTLSLVRTVAERFRETEELRSETRPRGSAHELAAQALMYLLTWGERREDSSLAGSWSAVAANFAELFRRTDGPWQARLESNPDLGFTIEPAKDSVVIRDPDRLRSWLAALPK